MTTTALLAWISHYTGVSSLFYVLNRRRKRIITYHNILPDADFTGALHEGVSHAESAFASQVEYLRQRSCDLQLDNESSVTITFDDGYLNQYAIAHPILKAAGLQAYFFVPVARLENDEPLAVDLILFWLSQVPKGKLAVALPTPDGSLLQLIITDDQSRLSCWQVIRRYLYSGNAPEAAIIEALDRCVPFDTIRLTVSAGYYRLRFGQISAEALGEMRASGHKIGPHSVSHHVMAALDDQALAADVASCVSQPAFNTDVFSYPFGGIDEVTPRVIESVRTHGFSQAVGNMNAPLIEGMAYGEHFLPRLSLPNTDKRYLMSFVLSGAKYFLQYGRLFPAWQ